MRGTPAPGSVAAPLREGWRAGGLCRTAVGGSRTVFLQDFLRKEFSEENILFWQACECFSHVPAHDKKEVRLSTQGQARCGTVPGGAASDGQEGE